MNIYFSCSITGGRAEESIYQAIVAELIKRGHDVPTAHLSTPEVVDLEKVVDPVEIYTRDMDWLRECDAVIAEVSSPSHGVGYEVAYGLFLNKPVLCCYNAGKRISKIITGNTSPTLTILIYNNENELIDGIRKFLSSISI